MNKKIISLCLIFILSLSVLGISTAFADTSVDVQLLIDLGVVEEIETKGLIRKGYTRGDFARSLVMMDGTEPLTLKAEGEGAEFASDIAGNENYDAITTVIAIGYMKTDDKNCFRPGHSLTLNEAVYALVHALGYDPIAIRNGGNDAAYMAIANKIGLMKGVKVNDPQKMGLSETAKMIANAMGIRFFSDGNINLEEQCFFDRWNLKKNTGKIIANSNFGIMSEKAPVNKVNISDTLYTTKLLIEDNMVGCEVTYYTTEGSFGDEVVSICVSKKAESVTIKAKDIVEVEDKTGYVLITLENGDEIEISKKGFAVVNGKTQSPDKELFDVFKSGVVTFLDPDGDGSFDIAHITLLIQSVVDGVNSESETINLRFDNQKIELEKVDAYEVYLNNKSADLSDLSVGDVIGIACDSYTISDGVVSYNYENADYIKLYASSRKGEGMVESISEDEVTVGDIPYRIGSGYARLVDAGHIMGLSLGDYVNLYQDCYGDVVYYETNMAKSSLKYGYLIAADANTNKPFGEATRAKIMDTEGKIHTFATLEEFILDGAKVSSGATSYAVGDETVDLTKRQVIRYNATDGVLKEIDTLALRAGVESVDSSLDAALSFDPYTAEQTKSKIIRGVINYKTAFAPDCVVFLDEALIDDVSPMEYNFSVVKSSDLDNEEYIACFDADENNLVSCVVAYKSYGLASGLAGGKLLSHLTYGYVVEKVTEAVNAEGESGYRLYVTGPNEQASYFVNMENLKLYYKTPGEKWAGENPTTTGVDASRLADVVKTGNVIRFRTNAQGEINYIENYFDFAHYKNITDNTSFQSNGVTFCWAKLEKIAGDYFIYKFDTDEKFMSRRSGNLDVVVYDVQKGTAKIVPLSEAPSAATGNEVKVFFRFYDYNYVYDSVVYVYN